MATNADDSAFSYQEWVGNEKWWKSGMNKREYFAAMAMQGMVANGEWTSPEETARHAIRLADALIKELNKQQ